jgi:hypothetical protein
MIDQDNLINWRFSRRCGEQHPDADYANPIEGPTDHEKANAAIDKWITIACLMAAVALTLILTVYK